MTNEEKLALSFKRLIHVLTTEKRTLHEFGDCKTKIGPFLYRIADILESDKQVPKKQRDTTKRIYERIKEEGYQGKCTQVKEAVSQTKRQSREIFMPLIHRPGEVQMDFGEAVAHAKLSKRETLMRRKEVNRIIPRPPGAETLL